MGNCPSQECQQFSYDDYYRRRIERMFQVLFQGGITILDEHSELTSHQRRSPDNNPGGSAEAQGDSQDKSSFSIFGPGHLRYKGIYPIARAYVNEKGVWGRSPLHLSAEIQDTDIVDVFLEAGAYVDAEDKLKQTPLHYSARHGHTELVETFLQAGANVNAEDTFNQTPLHDSAKRGHTEVVETLLKAGANVDAADENKQTPLHLSAENGHTEVVETLFLAGGNVDAKDKFKKTPLHYSAKNGHKEAVETLLKAEANVDAEDENKQTPLHFSSENGHQKVVEILLKAGANVDAENMNKQTSLYLSAKNGHKEEVEILLKAGANVEAEDKFKQTPLHISIISKQDGVIDLLLRAGASVKERDIWGRTSLYYMDDRQRLRFRFELRQLFKLSNWMYSLTNSKKRIQSSTSTKTKTEHTETISATFTDVDSRTPGERWTLPGWDGMTNTFEDNSNNNGQDDISSDSSTLLISGSPFRRSAETTSGPQSLCSPSSQTESQDLVDKDFQELSNIRQQVENHLAKLSLETTEGCETSGSHDVNAAFQAGRIVIPTTINITQNKITKNIKKVHHHYEPGTSLNINHANNVAPGGQIIIRQISNASDDNDDSFSEDGSSGEQ